MKLNGNFIVHRTERETLLVPVGGSGFAGIVKGNATLGDILSLLEQDITAPALLEAMAARYDAPVDALARDVDRALAELRAIGALDE
jgi:hypothetical protein